jgi:hypothetical protein
MCQILHAPWRTLCHASGIATHNPPTLSDPLFVRSSGPFFLTATRSWSARPSAEPADSGGHLVRFRVSSPQSELPPVSTSARASAFCILPGPSASGKAGYNKFDSQWKPGTPPVYLICEGFHGRSVHWFQRCRSDRDARLPTDPQDVLCLKRPEWGLTSWVQVLWCFLLACVLCYIFLSRRRCSINLIRGTCKEGEAI